MSVALSPCEMCREYSKRFQEKIELILEFDCLEDGCLQAYDDLMSLINGAMERAAEHGMSTEEYSAISERCGGCDDTIVCIYNGDEMELQRDGVKEGRERILDPRLGPAPGMPGVPAKWYMGDLGESGYKQ